MGYRIYNPEITTSIIVDTYNNPAGLKYVANTSLAEWGGRLWAVMDGSCIGYTEGRADQQIWMTVSEDGGATWSAPFQPFRDSAFCVNPMSGSNLEWQPNLVVVGGHLWCTWSGADGYVSKLSDLQGKWSTYRLEFVGEHVFLSQTITGSPSPGRTVSPSVGGITDWLPFFSGDPIVLAGGVVACPATIYSRATYSTQTGIANSFTKLVKQNVLFLADGDGWSMTRIPTTFPDFVAWEPFVVQNPVGDLYVFSRNLDPAADPVDRQLVARSTDGGRSFTPSVSTKMVVPSSRGFARQVGASRWFMAHCDPFNVASPLNSGRENGTLFVSRRGGDDFSPGVSFSEFDAFVKYPQFIAGANALYMHYTSGSASANTTSKGRFVCRLTKVSPLPADDVAYIHPRGRSRAAGISDPDLIEGSYYRFTGYTRMLSAAAVAPAGGVSYVAWLNNPYDPPVDAAVIDTRSGLSGSIFRVNGVSLRSMDLFHGWDLPLGRPLFLAAVINPTTMTVTHYAAYGHADFLSKTSHFRSILFTGQPSNGESVAINGVTYTFRTSPSVTNDVQIGASASATCANLKTAVEAAMASSSSNETSNLVIDTRLIMTRPDGAAFTATSSASNVTIESSVSLAGGNAYVGTSIPGSAVPNYRGHLYGARIYDGAMSVANLRSLYNARADDFGYAAIPGTSTAPGSPLVHVDPAYPDAEGFPPLGGPHCCEVVSDDLLRIHGEGSATVEIFAGATQLTIRYKLSAAPAATDKYVIATFGDVSKPARLFIDAADPTKLYLERNLVAAVTPTEWNTVTMVLTANKVTIGNVEYCFSGMPRCFLGSAYPENLLAASQYIDYDISTMKPVRA